jgi:hypothetical protein
VKVGFVGACDVPACFTTISRAGTAPMAAGRLEERVRSAKGATDLVVAVLHADLEFSRFPSPSRQRLSRRLIEAGADLVIQHHPHVCQGIEAYQNGLIAYSLGNFVFPVAGNVYMASAPGTDWGLILNVDITWSGADKRISWTAAPVTINHENQPMPSDDKAREAQLASLAEMSAGLEMPGRVREEWWKRCIREARSTYYVLAHARRREGSAVMFRDAFALLSSSYERRWMFGLLSRGYLG